MKTQLQTVKHNKKLQNTTAKRKTGLQYKNTTAYRKYNCKNKKHVFKKEKHNKKRKNTNVKRKTKQQKR